MRTIGYEPDRRERKTCATCGHLRLVKISTHVEKVAGVTVSTRESWSQHCTACALVRRAVVLENQACRFRERARQIRKRRAERCRPSSK